MADKEEQKMREAFGVAFAKARAHTGWSKAEMGRRIGVSPASVRFYERGERIPSAIVLLRLLDEMGFEDRIALRSDLMTALGMRWTDTEAAT